MAQRIGLIYDVAVSNETSQNLQRLEGQLFNVREELKQARKLGNEDLFGRLKAQETALKQEIKDVRKEVRGQISDFKKAKFPADSLIGLRKQYQKLRQEIDGLSADQRKSTFGDDLIKEASRVKKEIDEIGASVGDFRSQVGNYRKGALELDELITGGIITGGFQKIAGFAVDAALATGEYIRETTQQFIQLRGEVQNLTDAVGPALDQYTFRIKALSDTFDQDFNEVLNSANALSKQFGISVDESINLIETGFLAGANASNELLDNIKEYPTFFQEAGFSAEQMLQIINTQVEQGIYSDKGVDAVKEATIRIRENTTATQEALNAIGLTSEEVQATIDERGIAGAIALVSEKLQELEDDSPEVGQALADIFGAAGEDAGINFIKTLSNIDDSIEGLVDETNELTKSQRRQLEINQKLAESQNQLSRNFTALSVGTKGFRTQLLTLGTDIVNFFVRHGTFQGQIAENVSNVVDEVTKNQKRLADQEKIFIKSLRTAGFTVKAIAEQTGKSVSEIKKFFGIANDESKELETNFQALEKRQKELKQQILDAKVKGEPYVELLQEHNDVTNKLTGATNLFNDSVKKSKELAKNELQIIGEQIKKIRQELGNPSDQTDSEIAAKIREIIKLEEKLKTAEERITKIRIAVSGEREGDTEPLEDLGNELGLSDEDLQQNVRVSTTAEGDTDDERFRNSFSGEIELKKEEKDEILKIEKEKTEGLIAEAEERQQRLDDIRNEALENISLSVEEFIANQEVTFKNFQKAILSIALDVLRKRVSLYIVEIFANAFSRNPILGGILGAAAVGVVNGLLKKAESAIASFEKGGMIGGKSHAEGGTIIEAEKGEVIINKKAVSDKTPRVFRGTNVEVLDQINRSTGGRRILAPNSSPFERKFRDGGLITESTIRGVTGTAIEPVNQTSQQQSGFSEEVLITLAEMIGDRVLQGAAEGSYKGMKEASKDQVRLQRQTTDSQK